MKYIILFIILLFTLPSMSQNWINDETFEDTINPRGGFNDDIQEIVIVEFWAKFNKDNAFPDWKKLDSLPGVSYYRIDIATSPKLKKELRIRMAPTLLVYTKGDAYIKFKAKAGLDLLCPVDLPKMLKAIEVVRRESQF
jgi:hypothetical protein|tara:strand:+ start:128 stop:544 length:417 start_codon:yes stop_codon:yes gene_type:complete